MEQFPITKPILDFISRYSLKPQEFLVLKPGKVHLPTGASLSTSTTYYRSRRVVRSTPRTFVVFVRIATLVKESLLNGSRISAACRPTCRFRPIAWQRRLSLTSRRRLDHTGAT